MRWFGFGFFRGPKPQEIALSGEQYTVAIGPMPNRSDGVITLHVGPCWVILNEAEFQRVCNLGHEHFNAWRSAGHHLDTGVRRRRSDQ